MKNKAFSPRKKDRIKVIRSIIQGIILISILIIGIRAFFTSNQYEPIEDQDRSQTEKGFIALSYFGIDHLESTSLIGTQRFDDHLNALKNSGYVTISQEDIIAYYQAGKPLPEKSLFLILEDGRRDTAIFAQKFLEKYNYKGNILTYAQNLEKRDPKFLRPKDLLELEKSTYWEQGTNGYRLEYINVFDRYENFLNTLDTYQFQMLAPYLDRDYNHYLMDYIRDESGIPMENLNQMQDRIAYDYKELKEIYTNDKVSRENEKWMKELFKLNFNREGNALNLGDSSVYDLTRIQPQAYWHTNHLLMRIWRDTGEDLAFVSGDLERKADWDILDGAAEFMDETIVLTSLPGKRGLMKLKQSEDFQDISLSVELKGNQAGSQRIYLRADENLEKYVCVEIKNNILYIYDKATNGLVQEQLVLDLNHHDEIKLESVDENKLAAEIRELETQLRYVKDPKDIKELNTLLIEKKKLTVPSIEEGAKEYRPPIALSKRGNRLLEVEVVGNQIRISLDGKPIKNKIMLNEIGEGSVYLESAFSGYGYSQRNLADDVYDGVFEKLIITQAREEKEIILYDNRFKKIEKVMAVLKSQWDRLIGWFVKNF